MNMLKDNRKLDLAFAIIMYGLLLIVSFSSLSNPPISDSLEMFCSFHTLDAKLGSTFWLHVLNHDPKIAAERFFCPQPDMERERVLLPMKED